MRNFKLFLLVAAFLFPVHAFAWKVVYDPSNFGKNTVSAAENAKQTAVLANQYRKQIQQWQLEVQDLKQLNPSIISQGVSRGALPSSYAQGCARNPSSCSVSSALSASKGVYQNYDQLGSTMDGLTNVYQGLNTQTSSLNQLSVNSGLSTEELLASEIRAKKTGQLANARQFENLQSLNQQLGGFQRRADYLATQIPDNKGTVEAISTLSAQNHLLTDQLSGLLQASVSQAETAAIQNNETLNDKIKADNSSVQAATRNKEIKKYFGIQ